METLIAALVIFTLVGGLAVNNTVAAAKAVNGSPAAKSAAGWLIRRLMK